MIVKKEWIAMLLAGGQGVQGADGQDLCPTVSTPASIRSAY